MLTCWSCLTFVDSYNDVLVLLGLAHFIPLLNCFDYSGRREMSAYLVNNVIGRSIKCPVYISFVNTSAVDPDPCLIFVGWIQIRSSSGNAYPCPKGQKDPQKIEEMEGISCCEVLDVYSNPWIRIRIDLDGSGSALKPMRIENTGEHPRFFLVFVHIFVSL
jgi:hypothetical protein